MPPKVTNAKRSADFHAKEKVSSSSHKTSLSSAASGRKSNAKGLASNKSANKLPKGLESLEKVDRLLIQHIPSLDEIGIKDEIDNRYCISNTAGQKLFYAGENVGHPRRMVYHGRKNKKRSWRNFEITIFDNKGVKVMNGRRDAPFPVWCCCCMKDDVYVNHFLGLGNIGTIFKDGSYFRDRWTIKNGFNDPDLSLCTHKFTPCLPDLLARFKGEFLIANEDAEEIGKIFRPRDLRSDIGGPVYEVTFPRDMHVIMKAMLIFATFLVEAKYYHSETPEGALR